MLHVAVAIIPDNGPADLCTFPARVLSSMSLRVFTANIGIHGEEWGRAASIFDDMVKSFQLLAHERRRLPGGEVILLQRVGPTGIGLINENKSTAQDHFEELETALTGYFCRAYGPYVIAYRGCTLVETILVSAGRDFPMVPVHRIRFEGHEFQLMNVHMPSSDKWPKRPRRIIAVKELLSNVERMKGPLIAGGNFNLKADEISMTRPGHNIEVFGEGDHDHFVVDETLVMKTVFCGCWSCSPKTHEALHTFKVTGDGHHSPIHMTVTFQSPEIQPTQDVKAPPQQGTSSPVEVATQPHVFPDHGARTLPYPQVGVLTKMAYDFNLHTWMTMLCRHGLDVLAHDQDDYIEVQEGVEVRILPFDMDKYGPHGGWCLVRAEGQGKTGWVPMRYLMLLVAGAPGACPL